ncbi:putative magnesium transporter NIPA8 [Dictyocoela muelleri]|nr:putative magnesium transporter NIPA8 [Dictyocoela muelleri]
MFFVFVFGCKVDSDCWIKNRPDIHSLYCVEGRCSHLLPAGRHCSQPQDCASYFFYGSLACSAQCKVENACEYDDGKVTRFCCKSVPEGQDCMPGRPNLLNGCESKQVCVMDPDGEFKCMSKSKNYWIFGVILSVCGNLNISLGLNLQKKSFTRSSFIIGNFELNTFYIGLFLYVVGKTLGFSSYIFGNQSVLASLGAVGLIANSIFAPMINNEIFTWRDFAAIFLVLTGSSVILANTSKTPKIYSLCELMKMYQRKETILWFLFIAFLIITLFFTIKFIEINSDWHLPGDYFQFLSIDTIFFDENRAILKYTMIIFYVGLSATIASLTTLFAKSFGEMIDQTINGDNQFINGITYIFLILIILCTTLQVFWLNRALRHYDALLAIPVFHVIWTVFSVITGAVYFNDFEYYTVTQLKGFVAGLAIIFLGSGFLATRILSRNVVVMREVVLERFVVGKDE